MTPTSTLHLACPTCGDEIEVEYEMLYNGQADAVSLRTFCFDAISREHANDLILDYSARQAELATEGEG